MSRNNSLYNPKVGKDLTKAAKTGSDRIHVIARGDGWIVKKDGNDRIIKRYSSQSAAIKHVHEAFKNNNLKEYVIHGKDGAIKEWKTKK